MQDELQQLQRLLEGLIGRPSRWSGVLEITSDPDIRGAKPFRCDIILHESLAGQDVRWRTLLHEMLHTFSAGYNRTDFEQFPGWEEGLVEQTQRLLRPAILAELGVTVDEAVFQEVEAAHRYNAYIDALEVVRRGLAMQPEAFYTELLAVPICRRKASLFRKMVHLPPEQTRLLVTLLSQQNVVLTRKL